MIYSAIRKLSIELAKIPPESRSKLCLALGIKDQRPVAYVIEGSALLAELQKWIQEEIKS